MNAPDTRPRLHLLRGEEAPPGLAEDLKWMQRLPPEAVQRLWQVLGPCLAEALTEEHEKLLDVFCSAYGLPGEDLARLIKACRFVIRGAACLDVPEGALGEDVDKLCPDAPVVREILLAGYEEARKRIRSEIIQLALVDHGKLLTGVRYRLDAIDSCDRGINFRVPVALLTLEYREGIELKRLTLQVLPDTMATLRDTCERVLS